MASATLAPVEEYLRTRDQPNCRHIDGVATPAAGKRIANDSLRGGDIEISPGIPFAGV